MPANNHCDGTVPGVSTLDLDEEGGSHLPPASIDKHSEPFAMVWPDLLGFVLDRTRSKVLRPFDLLVFLALVEQMRFPTGRIDTTLAALAQRLDVQLDHLQRSVVRLRRLGLVARLKDPQSRKIVFLLDPALCSQGGKTRRATTMEVFREALGQDPPPKRPAIRPGAAPVVTEISALAAAA